MEDLPGFLVMVSLVFAGLALLGHMALGVWVINRVHGLGIQHDVQRRWDALWYAWQLLLPIAVLVYCRQPAQPLDFSQLIGFDSVIGFVASCYLAIGQLGLLWGLMKWVRRKWAGLRIVSLLSNDTKWVDLQERTVSHLPADIWTDLLAKIPGNQILQLCIHEKRLWVPRLPAVWEGVRIAHLSDLHLTGQLSEAFFHEIVDLTNQGQPDLIAITGDIVDKDRCIPWLQRTLGRLKAPLGVWFVLGNHDQRVRNVEELRAMIAGMGLTDLGGQAYVLWRGESPLVLAGNELPWFSPAIDLDAFRTNDPRLKDAFTIVLSHSPDQIVWAKQQQVDLLLAGHTHGGQVRIPIVGPVLSPSVFGVEYASGTFDCPPTVMHVSRGLSGTRPFRFRCAPELAFLTLTRVV